MSKNLTKEEREIRLETEDKLKGRADKIRPPTWLNKEQKKIFKYIVKELEESEVLGNLDVYILTQCAVSIDRLQEIEKLINGDVEAIYSKSLMGAKDKYSKIFFRCCNELSLSPQSRAKLGTINLQAKERENDPLLNILAGGN